MGFAALTPYTVINSANPSRIISGIQMEKEHRISAAAIIIQNNKILLVRYRDSSGGSFLVGPGGGTLSHEGINQTVIREVQEETGLTINPLKILIVEDLLSLQSRMVKIWFLCEIIGGELNYTQGAKEEGIIEVGWYRKEQLKKETVYPSPVMSNDWDSFSSAGWKTMYLELKQADF